MSLQKLLGRNYKWWYTIKYYFKLRTAYRVDNFFFALGNVTTLLGTILIWFFASGGVVDTDLKSKIGYFFFGTIYFGLVNIWPSFFGYSIKRGQHVTLMLRPSNFILSIFCMYLGIALFQSLTMIVILLVFSPVLMTFTTINILWSNILWLILLWLPSILIHFFLELNVAFLAFFVTEINGIILNFDFLKGLLMGRLIPLNLFLASFGLGLLNPFSFIFYQPMQILFGNFSFDQIVLTILAAFAWVVVLIAWSNFVLKLGLKKNESVGL